MNSPAPVPRPAPFEVETTERDGNVRVLSVRGELDLSTAPKLEETLEEALSSEGASILIDLSACEFIDSTGIALLVRSWQHSGAGGTAGFAICCAKAQVSRVLEISGVGASIPLLDGMDTALATLDTSVA